MFVLLAAVAIVLQWQAGAYMAELGVQEPDEAAHYITGLMIHDWIIAGFPPPFTYAREYYVHYPKVAIGVWPPFFHSVEAVWMLPFSSSRASVLILMGLITAGLALALFHTARRESSVTAAACAALLLVTMPIVQYATTKVMVDATVALLCWLSVLAMARFIRTNRTADILLAGVLAACAVLTKGNALALGLAIPLVPLLARRPRVLFDRRLWIVGAVVALVVTPWEILTLRFQAADAFHVNWAFVVKAVGYYPAALADQFGPVLLCFCLLGIFGRLILPWLGRTIQPHWAAAGALLAGGIVFHCIAPWGPDVRYLEMVVAPMILFLVAGLRAAAEIPSVPARVRHLRFPLLAAAVGVVFAATVFHIPGKPHVGFTEAAKLIAGTPEFQRATVLVSSGRRCEGALISELAMIEKRPGHVILRGRKVLSSSTWNGKSYAAFYDTPAAVSDYLESIPVDLIVVDNGKFPRPDHQMLLDLLRDKPKDWRLLATYTTRGGGISNLQVSVYRRGGPIMPKQRTIRIPMQYTLGESIEY